jgi:hypothetical protein
MINYLPVLGTVRMVAEDENETLIVYRRDQFSLHGTS